MIPAIALSFALSGNPIPQLAFTFGDMAQKLDGIQTDLGLGTYLYNTAGGPTYRSMIDIFAITLALMCGTAGLPHVIIRFYTVPSVRAARYSGGWALLFIGLLYTTAPSLAAMAKLNLIDTFSNQPLEQVQALPWVQSWEATGLLKFDDKNGDGILQFASGDANEVTIDRDIIVLSTPEVAGLAGPIIGLVAAGGLAAALSTASGLLLVISSSFSHDIYYRVFKKTAAESERLKVARITILGAILIAGWFGINPPGFVAEVVAFAFGLAAASFFPIILLGIFDRRMNNYGAIWGMVVGITFTAIMILIMRSMPLFGTEPLFTNFMGISAQGIGSIGMILNFIVAFTVSRMTAAPPEEIQEMVENVRIPRGAGEALAH
jgi:cation/acetate symporter